MSKTTSLPVSPTDLKELVYGACFSASGGGGPISMALNFLDKIDCSLPMVTRTELEADKKVLILADMGSPDATKEGRGYTAPVNAFYVLDDYLKQNSLGEAAYLMPIEIGAVNTLIPFYIASQLDTPLPVLDADPSGRSVPQLNETLLDISSAAICPAAVASDTISSSAAYASTPSDCHHVIFRDTSTTPTELEDEARKVVSSPLYHQVGGLACYPMDSSWVSSSTGGESLVESSISGAIAIGNVLLTYASQGYSVLEPELKSALSDQGKANYVLASGELTVIDNRTSGGFDVGRLTFKLSNGSAFWVYYKNESLLAWDPESGKPLAIGPDCINLLLMTASGDFDQCTPLSTADISEGMELAIWGTSCDSKMRNSTTEGLFMEDIQQILAAFPEDPVTVTGYQTIESLNS